MLRGNGWRRQRWIVLALALGVTVRVLYTLITPFDLRGHDHFDHLRYVHHVYLERTIPDWRQGTEYYQPPLYYFLAAFVVDIGSWAGLRVQDAALYIQALSVLLSCLALAVGLGMGGLLFPGEPDQGERSLFSMLLALFPATIIDISGRINNDVLAHVLGLLFIAAILRWWARGGSRAMAAAGLLLGLGLLTKASLLVLGGMASLLILLRKDGGAREKGARLGILWGIAVAMSGWFFALRFAVQGQRQLVGNIDIPFVRAFADAHLRVPNDLAAFLAFNPLAVLEAPFNNPWDDSARRDHFAEFYFRSALFGEHDFGPGLRTVATALVFLGLLLLPLLLSGLVCGLRRQARASLPMLLLLALPMAAVVVHRAEHPYSCNQDFRFASWSVVAVCFWVAKGAFLPLWGVLGRLVTSAFVALALLFFLRLYAG